MYEKGNKVRIKVSSSQPESGHGYEVGRQMFVERVSGRTVYMKFNLEDRYECCYCYLGEFELCID